MLVYNYRVFNHHVQLNNILTYMIHSALTDFDEYAPFSYNFDILNQKAMIKSKNLHILIQWNV